MLTLCLYLLLALTHHAFPYRGKRLLYSYMHTSQIYKLAYYCFKFNMYHLRVPSEGLKMDLLQRDLLMLRIFSMTLQRHFRGGQHLLPYLSQSIPIWNCRRLYSNVLLYIYFTYYFIYFIYHITLSLYLVTYPMLVLPYLESPKALQQHHHNVIINTLNYFLFNYPYRLDLYIYFNFRVEANAD